MNIVSSEILLSSKTLSRYVHADDDQMEAGSDMTSPQATDAVAEKRAEFLLAMRNVANSVTVVTTDGPGGRQGATVSSFCSVSADPPTLLVCLNKASRICQSVIENKVFCVNVLPDGMSETAHRFAGFKDDQTPDRFIGEELETGLTGPDVITNATSFVCSTEQSFSSGSHMVFIGLVTAIHNGRKNPLIYMNGEYRRIAPKE